MDLVATQIEMQERLCAAQCAATDAEQSRITMASALAQHKKQLKMQTSEHTAALLQVERLRMEVLQLRERTRANIVQEAVGTSINSMRNQLADARAMHSRIEAESTVLAQENDQLLSVNAELRAQCELLGNNVTIGGKLNIARSPKILQTPPKNTSNGIPMLLFTLEASPPTFTSPATHKNETASMEL